MSTAELLPFEQNVLIQQTWQGVGTKLARDGRWAIYSNDCCMADYGQGDESPTIEDCIIFYGIMDAVHVFNGNA